MVILLLISGCSTNPIIEDQATSTPQDRIFYKDQKPPREHASKVTFIRDSGLFGSGVYLILSINEKRAAAIDVAEKVTFHLLPGTYVFGVKPANAETIAEYFVTRKIEAGLTYNYRLLMDGNAKGIRIEDPQGTK